MATRAVAQTVCFVAWDTTNNVGKTGDGANFTMRWVKDGTSAALTVTTVTEIDSTNVKGLYKVGISSTEADCNIGYLGGVSSTSGISIMPVKIEFERLPDAVPGAAGGVFISGTNSSLTITGTMTVSGGIVITNSNSNQPAFKATGNGSGQGASFIGGSGAAGVSISGTGAASGLTIGAGSGAGTGLSIVGGGTSGVGLSITTTSGDGVSILPTAGHGIVATANGASKHGMQLTGGGSGTCDGLKAVAGTGGVAIRGPVDVVTLVNTLTTYTGNTPQTGDSFALIGTAGAGLTALATQASVNTIDDFVDTEIAAIQSTLSTIAGYIDTEVAAIKAKTDNLPADTSATLATIASYIDTEVASIISSLSTLTGYVDTEVAAIKAKTDNLPANTATTLSGIETKIDTVDTVVDSILDDTGTSGVKISAAQMNAIADHVRRRTQANVFASSDGDAISKNSLYGFIQQAQKSSVSAGTQTILNTDGTTLGTNTLTSSASADPVTGVS